jgi:hypothetical protein
MHRFMFLAALLLSVAFATPAFADSPSLFVDGVAVQNDVPAIVDGDHVLVPLRGVFERFGAEVDYDAASDTVVAFRDGVIVKVAVGTQDAWIDGRHFTMDTAAREIDGRVEVPLRFVAQSLGAGVDYDAATNTVYVSGGRREGNFVAAGPGTPAADQLASYEAGGGRRAGGNPPSIEDESPSPDSVIGADYPQIYARFAGGSSPVDPATVRLMLDGSDITASATVSSAYIAYTPPAPLDAGSHTVEISGQAEDGTPFDVQWSFRLDTAESGGYVGSIIGYGPGRFGYGRFGFHPPGFSAFAPGPQFFYFGQPIVFVFFSPFFPVGDGFFTVAGVPGHFRMTPWLGCPGYYWAAMQVPEGLQAADALVAAHFVTSDGRKVVVQSTAPLHIDGTRASAPAELRYAVKARLVDHPATPRALVAFTHFSTTTYPVTRSGRDFGAYHALAANRGWSGRPSPAGNRPSMWGVTVLHGSPSGTGAGEQPGADRVFGVQRPLEHAPAPAPVIMRPLNHPPKG